MLEAGAEAGASLVKFRREVEDLGASVGDVDKRSTYVVPLRQRRQKVWVLVSCLMRFLYVGFVGGSKATAGMFNLLHALLDCCEVVKYSKSSRLCLLSISRAFVWDPISFDRVIRV